MAHRFPSLRSRRIVAAPWVVLAVAVSGCAAGGGGGAAAPTIAEIGRGDVERSVTSRTSVVPTTQFKPTTTTHPPELRSFQQADCPGAIDSGAKKGGAVGRAPSTTTPTATKRPSVSSTTAPASTTSTSTPGADDGSSSASSTDVSIPPSSTTTIPTPRSAIEAFSKDPRLAGTTRSVSVWIEGTGEAAAEDADSMLIPASNQKVVTAIGALAYLDHGERLNTDLIATGPIEDGVLKGDLVLVGGGDPTVQASGPHSIDFLAQVVANSGLTRVDGRILVDESRYDSVRTGQNWPGDWLYSVGPLSALGVDHNMFTKERSFVDDPARGNAEILKFALGTRGIGVSGGVDVGRAEEGVLIAQLQSPPVKVLVATMLRDSDNFIAELLVKEIAFRQTRRSGSTAAGIAAIHELLGKLCVPIAGVDVDGSGLSRDNRRSAREFRRLLQVAEIQPWGEAFVSGLSIAGEENALGGRLAGPATAGRVRAKGGFLFVSRALSGYLTTTDGRHVVFSVLVNGNLQRADRKVEDAIDELLTAVAASPVGA